MVIFTFHVRINLDNLVIYSVRVKVCIESRLVCIGLSMPHVVFVTGIGFLLDRPQFMFECSFLVIGNLDHVEGLRLYSRAQLYFNITQVGSLPSFCHSRVVTV